MPCCAAWSCSRNQKCTARPWQTSAKDDVLVSYSRNASKYTFPNASLHPPISGSGRESTYQNRRVRALKRIDFWKDQGTGEFWSMRNTVVGSSPSVVRSKVSLAEQDSGQKLMIDNNYLLRGRRFQEQYNASMCCRERDKAQVAFTFACKILHRFLHLWFNRSNGRGWRSYLPGPFACPASRKPANRWPSPRSQQGWASIQLSQFRRS